MSITIALAGNPNCGKTTLFNALTGANQYVGNWPGVTVEKKEGKLKGSKDILIQDLPGHGQAAGRDRLHRVRTAASPLLNMWGTTSVVNSAHHQAIDRLGQGLRAVQWTADGTVEAVIHQALPVWGVQWHPERLTGSLALPGAAEGGRLFAAWLTLSAGSGEI